MIDVEIIIQARLSSSRMPRKVLKEFCSSQCILDLQLKALDTLKIPLLLATTTNPNDDALEDFAVFNKLRFFRGSESDVMDRFLSATKADFIIRICSDNPFLDIHSISTFIEQIQSGTDYISYKNMSGIPSIRTHWGLFGELVSRKALLQAFNMTKNNLDKDFYREHVTNYIYGNPNQFQVLLLDAPENIKYRKDLRFTIDTPEDFENMQRLYTIIEQEGGDFSLGNLIRTADAHSEIKKVMEEGIARFSK